MKNLPKAKMILEAAVVIAVALAFVLPGSAAVTNSNIIANLETNSNAKLLTGEWTEQASAFTTPSRGIRYLDAVNATIAWAIAYDGSGSNLPTTDITRTINGGTEWIPGSVVGDNNYGLGNICGVSGTLGYVALFNQADPANQDESCGAYKTDDGGTTWTQLGHYPISFANNVIFWNEMEGVVLGDFKDSYFEDYTTHDGGATWQRVPQANYSGLPWVSGEAGWTGVVDVVGDTVAFGTNEGNVYISHNRGDTWFAAFSGASTGDLNAGVNELAFKDAMHGLAAHDNGVSYDLFETSDGGVTWAPVTYTGTAYSASLGYVPGTPNMYISTGGAQGSSGASYSNDGGHNWIDYDDMIGLQMLANDFVAGGVGWAGAFNTDETTGGMYKYVKSTVPEPTLVIESISGGKNISAVIKNIGDADATAVAWTIDITGGLFIKPRNATGTIPTLAAGASKTITMNVKGIGLGILFPMPSIKVSASCNEKPTPVIRTANAKIFFTQVTIQ